MAAPTCPTYSSNLRADSVTEDELPAEEEEAYSLVRGMMDVLDTIASADTAPASIVPRHDVSGPYMACTRQRLPHFSHSPHLVTH